MGDSIKSWKDLDFDAVDFNSGWAWSRAGTSFSISHVDEDLAETEYKMPSCINSMLRQERRFGKESVRSEMKKVLGCCCSSGNSCPLDGDPQPLSLDEVADQIFKGVKANVYSIKDVEEKLQKMLREVLK